MGKTLRLVGTLAAFLALGAAPAIAQPDLSGQWTLNRGASQLPPEIGFGINWQTGGTGDATSKGGGVEGGSSRNFVAPRESAEDAARLRALTDEARTPPERLTITQAPGAVTIAAAGGPTRTFHPNGRQELLRLADDVPLVAASRWDGDRLVVTYDVEEKRQIRYTYAVGASPRQLTVETKFLDHGKGDSVERVYDAATAAAVAPSPAQPVTSPPPSAPVPAATPARPSAAQAPKADLAPGAELRGLTTLGVVVEDPGSQATACGLTRDALASAVSQGLSKGGLKIVRNTDEDTYLYVNVMAAGVGGTCVSHYDVTLYTHTTAALPYSTAPALVQVELLHNSGMAGGAPAANAQAVVRAVGEAVDQFVARIRQANGH